jgi:hypothetical protein
MEDRAHPLWVALGQVVVDRDHVRAPAGHGVERGGERRDEGFALARLHLRDPALVKHHRAHQLDVERAHLELAPGDLAGGGKDLGQRVIEDVLEVCDVVLVARLAQLGPTFGAVRLELVLGRLGRCRVLANLVAQLNHPGTDVGV